MIGVVSFQVVGLKTGSTDVLHENKALFDKTLPSWVVGSTRKDCHNPIICVYNKSSCTNSVSFQLSLWNRTTH